MTHYIGEKSVLKRGNPKVGGILIRWGSYPSPHYALPSRTAVLFMTQICLFQVNKLLATNVQMRLNVLN